MDTIIDQQVAMDEALIPHTKRLRIGRSNFCLLSDIKSKESTLQLVYNVLRLTSFFKAFLVTADVPEIYMQEFWATATIHHHAIRFKMDNMKHIVNLDSFKDMLHICPRLPGQSFVEPTFEEEILDFLCFLGHSEAIRKLTDVNINKLHQPWRSFVEHKDTKKSNKMYYPRFTKVIIHHFMSKDPSILRRNKVKWHYVRDDHMFTTIKLVSRHHNTQQFDALLPIELTNEVIRNSNAYQEYYAVATGSTPPKRKASFQKTKSSSDATITPLTAAAGPRLTTFEKGKQAAKASKANILSALSEVAMTEAQQLKLATKRSLQQTHISQASSSGADEGTGNLPGVPDVPTDESEEDISWKSTDDEDKGDDDEDDEKKGGDDEEASDEEECIHPSLSTHTEEEPRDEEEGYDKEEEEDELYRDININQGMVAPLPMSASTITPSTIATITTTQQASTPPTIASSTLLQDLPNFGSLFGFDNRLRTIEENFSEFMQMNPFAGASDHLRDEAQKENDEFLKTIDENMQKIIKEQVKEQVKRHRDDDADKDKEPSAGSNRGSKRRREGKEPESASALKEKVTRSMEELSHPEFETGADDQPIVESSQYPEWFSQQYYPPTLDCDWNKTLSATHESIQPWIRELAKQSDSHFSFKELMDTLIDFSNFLINRLKVDTLTLELLAGPTYELMKGSCKSLVELEFFLEEVYNATTDQLDWVNPEDDDKLYKFKEGNFKRLRIQDIEDMLLLLVQEKLTNLTVKEHFAFNVSLRIFTRSIVIQRRVEYLYLGVKSHQKKLNLTRPDTYRSDLKRKEAYSAYSNPRGFIYQNKDKQNRLMRIDDLHKFSDGTLTDVHTALDDRLKGIRIKYLPHSIWRKSDKDRAVAMIQILIRG
nr:hypothetical protein [Tanacetum cinerariifolium]